MTKKNLIIKEDGICPSTGKHCDDECCPVGATCNLNEGVLTNVQEVLDNGYYTATNQFKWMRVEATDALFYTAQRECVPVALFQFYQYSTGGGEWKRIEIELK